jgi:predicted RNA-binding protein with EMAP domain
MDTSKDIRIQFVEKAIASLERETKQGSYGSIKKHPAVLEGLQEIAGSVLAMKYAYLDEAGLYAHPSHEAILDRGRDVLRSLSDLAGDDREKRARLRFYSLVLEQFKESWKLPASLDSCLAVEAGTVSTTSKHPKAKGLILTHVDVFGESLQIVTNLVSTRSGQTMKVAGVYPAEVMGVLSEAQFVGQADPSASGRGRVSLTEDERQEIRRSIGAFMDG